MATYTENYSLAMPTEEDFYDVTVFNENFEDIDTLMAETESGINEVNEKLGTTDDSETGSVFSKLNALQAATESGGSVIKSIQHVTYTKPNSTGSGKITIDEVDPEKTFVIFERLYDDDDVISKLTYTLNATSISVTHGSNTSAMTIGFWVIEFY